MYATYARNVRMVDVGMRMVDVEDILEKANGSDTMSGRPFRREQYG